MSKKQILPQFLKRVKRYQSSQTQKNCHAPPKVQVRDEVGPANTLSNLHPIRYVKREDETPLETKLRESREELQEWNQLFWSKHNASFAQSKAEFEKKLLKTKNSDDQTITADEMSVFYKKFLDENWQTHFKYLFTWYKKNVTVTFLHLNVLFIRFISSLSNKTFTKRKR